VKIAPGEYTVAAAAPGFVPMAKSFTAGSTPLLLELRLESAPDAAMRQAALPGRSRRVFPSRRSRRAAVSLTSSHSSPC